MLKICAIVETKKTVRASVYMGGIPDTSSNQPTTHNHTEGIKCLIKVEHPYPQVQN